MALETASKTASEAPSHRAVCGTCLRPQRACICRWIAPIAPQVDVLILQHPAEALEAKGSARLLHLSLARSRLVVGEVFSEAQLYALLHAPLDAATEGAVALPYPVLLYPATAAGNLAPAPNLDGARLRVPHNVRLVVLDATWRKSLKMLAHNPLLQALPRIGLDDASSSAYLIRKARHAHQLSTLEATCHALAQLEHDREKYRPLLAAFDGFVAQQLAFRPASPG